MRGQHEDYDRWRQRGNAGWGYDDVLPYFKKAENQQRGADEYHGVGGPLPVSDLAACRSALGGLHRRGGRDRHCRSIPISTARPRKAPDFSRPRRGAARRASTAVAYLRPAKGRGNLRVETVGAGAAHPVRGTPRARRSNTGRAVRCEPRGRARRFWFRAALIIRRNCCSFPASARRSCCSKHGIDVVLDAPGVGNDLQDHLQVRVVMRCSQPITLNDIVNHPVRRMMAGVRYAAFRKGPLTIAAGTSGAFFKTNPRLATPDIQIHFLPFSTDKMGEKLHPFSGFTASVCQLRPESRGSLRIRSADPAVPPEIRINYLATETDRTAFVEGMKILRKILAAPALKPYVVDEVDPGAEGRERRGDAGLSAAQRGSTIYHPTSTCRMGNDPLAVVDQRLRVRGIEGLRVVDASIMPDLVSGNTNAPTIMIAEKASDMILEDAR